MHSCSQLMGSRQDRSCRLACNNHWLSPSMPTTSHANMVCLMAHGTSRRRKSPPSSVFLLSHRDHKDRSALPRGPRAGGPGVLMQSLPATGARPRDSCRLFGRREQPAAVQRPSWFVHEFCVVAVGTGGVPRLSGKSAAILIGKQRAPSISCSERDKRKARALLRSRSNARCILPAPSTG